MTFRPINGETFNTMSYEIRAPGFDRPRAYFSSSDQGHTNFTKSLELKPVEPGKNLTVIPHQGMPLSNIEFEIEQQLDKSYVFK